jgi:hypothetical protein
MFSTRSDLTLWYELFNTTRQTANIYLSMPRVIPHTSTYIASFHMTNDTMTVLECFAAFEEEC